MKSKIMSLYKLLPSIIFYKLFRKRFTPSFYKYLTTKGSFKTKLKNGESITLSINHSLYIEKEIFWNGIPCEFEPYTLDIWSELAREADVIFDIGANTGIFSVIAKANSKKSSIHAFEPIPYNFNILEKNIELNNFKGIHVNKSALSNEKGEATMYIKENEVNYINSVNLNRYSKEKVKEIKVPLVTLYEYIKFNNISKIDLIKIDVEGHEVEVLKGMGEYLNKLRPTILIEILNKKMAKTLTTLFSEIQYSFYLIDDENYLLVEKEKIEVSTRVNYLLKPKVI